MSCISLPKQAVAGGVGDDVSIRWASVVRGIRIHAVCQQADAALDLLHWADFLEGLSQLNPDGGR